MFAAPFPPFDLKQCSARSLLFEKPLTDALNIDYPMKRAPSHIRMAGSCNGLICIVENSQDFFLWNPSIRKTKRVPSMDLEGRLSHSGAYGFGFDDDYKIVVTFSVSEEGRYKYIMMVYGLRSGSWKRVGELEGGIPLPNSIKFASGKIHWWAKPETGTRCSKRDIVCLALESGVYGTVEQPDYEKDYEISTLGVLGGCICVVGYDSYEHTDVWVLKEYGVRGSWSKVSHFSCIQQLSVLLKPLCLLPNGDMLLVSGCSFIVCKAGYDSFTVLKPTKLDRFFDADIFIESLVSPGAYSLDKSLEATFINQNEYKSSTQHEGGTK